jgi:hypothetical protein
VTPRDPRASRPSATFDERKETHRATDAELAAAGVDFAWVPTPAVGDPSLSLGEFDGLLISPATTEPARIR